MKRLFYSFLAILAIGAYIFIQSDMKLPSDLLNTFSTTLNKENQLETDQATIKRVIDGDTVIIHTSEGIEERVRLLLIDTPESVHPTEPEQLFGKESSNFAKSILHEGDIITIEIGNPERDKYDRLLAYIWIDDINFNQLMIESGYARIAYVYEPNTKYLAEFKKAEDNAKKEKINIWSIDGYVTDNGFDMSVVN